MSLSSATHGLTILIRSAAMLHVALSLVPGMAQGAVWSFDSVYGATTSMVLPGGQASLVLDGAGQQARSITYTPTDGATPVSIVRAYGPGERKTIESESGTTRHHVYGAGLAPILRTDSDGGYTYQAGLDTIVVDATGAVSVVHRVADLKHSTVAVLGDPGQQYGQRVSYTSFGSMRLEKTGTGPFTEAVQEAAYEGLTVWLPGDPLFDNRARQYEPASGRFLGLDRAGQAIAYEARGNNPVSRVDPDGNNDFDQLIAAIKQDHGIPIVIGDQHESLEMANILSYLITRLRYENIPIRIYQETNLLAMSPVSNRMLNKRFKGSVLEMNFMSLLTAGFITDLGIPHTEITGEQAAKFKASYTRRDPKEKYKIAKANYDMWEQSIPEALAASRKKNVVSIFFMGGDHLSKVESALQRGPLFIHGQDTVMDTQGAVAVIPMSSYGIQSKYGMVAVFSNGFANEILPDETVFTAMDFRFEAGGKLPRPYQVWIPEKTLMKHKALITRYSKELVSRFEMKLKKTSQNNDSAEKDEEKENDEKKDADSIANQDRPAWVLPVNKPGNASPFPKFDEK